MGRERLRAARCRVRHLMRALGSVSMVRGPAWTTTTRADATAERPADLVDHQFVARRPNQLWVADSTYVATWTGFCLRRLRDRHLCGALSAGESPARCARISCSMPWTKPFTPAVMTRLVILCTTATAAANTCRCAIPSGWPTRALNHRSAVTATVTIVSMMVSLFGLAGSLLRTTSCPCVDLSARASSTTLKLPRFGRHLNSQETASGVCHDEAEASGIYAGV
jgi:hypothetical protein